MFGRTSKTRQYGAKFAIGCLHAIAGVVVAGSIGLALGVAGEWLLKGFRVRVEIAVSLVALVGTYAALERLLNLGLLERNQQTSRSWTNRPASLWAIYNGGLLGAGIATRLGSSIWYLVPAAAFLSATPVRGLVIYGIYGLARSGLGLLGMMLWLGRSGKERHEAAAARARSIVQRFDLSVVAIGIVLLAVV
jgi:hypothetical protein